MKKDLTFYTSKQGVVMTTNFNTQKAKDFLTRTGECFIGVNSVAAVKEAQNEKLTYEIKTN